MDKHLRLTSELIVFFSCSAAMAAPVTVPAGQFPNFLNGEYMQPNMVYQSSAIAANMAGVYEGEVWANAVYIDGAICEAGTYLPANTVICETCLENNYCTGGTFTPSSENQGISACADGFVAPAGSTTGFDCQSVKVLCLAGRYLPAFETSCAVCPENNYCPGGAYDRNYEEPQGLVPCLNGQVSAAGSSEASDCHVVDIICPAGKYLPAHATDCEICSENNYCTGGVFYYPRAANQGITPCADGLVAPEGTKAANLCGKIMHIGEDVLYLTSERQTMPALAVKLNGKVYYAKMTNGAVPINGTTSTYLETIVDGNTYTIHDNTVEEQTTQGGDEIGK